MSERSCDMPGKLIEVIGEILDFDLKCRNGCEENPKPVITIIQNAEHDEEWLATVVEANLERVHFITCVDDTINHVVISDNFICAANMAMKLLKKLNKETV